MGGKYLMATLTLGKITTTNDVTTIGSIKLDNTLVGKQVTVAAGSAKSVALNVVPNKNYGTLKMDADGNLTLIGGSALKGDITIVNDNGADVDVVKKLTRVDFGAAVEFNVDGSYSNLKTVNGSTGNDKFTVSSNLGEDFVLNAGAGKDTIELTADGKVESKINAGVGDDLVIVGNGEYSNVALGAGKDTVQFAGKATVNLTDYNYNQDVIDSSDTAVLSNNGTLTLGSDFVVSGITAANNLYLARVGTKNTTVYATAAEDTAKAVVDASSITDKTVIINTESADSAMITAGKADLTAITLNSNADAGVDTVKVGNATAKAAINVVNFNTDDVLSFTGLAFDKTNISLAGDDVTLTNGKVSVNLGKNVTVDAASVTVGAASSGKVAKFNLDGKTLYATTEDDQVINLTEEEDITKVLVAGQNDATKSSGIMTSAQLVDLRSSNFHNIDKVVLSADTAAKASVIGTKSSKIGLTIDASRATDGVAVWANNSTSKGDTIVFGGANDVADTLWLGSADGKDTVMGFDYESDVLYLADATSMTVDKGVIKVGKSQVSINGAGTDTDEIIQVQGAKFEGTVYAAGNFNSDGVVTLGENASKANYYAVGKKAAVSISSAMSDTYTFLKDIDYAGASKANVAAGGSVDVIDASATTEDAKVIVEGVANVSTGAGTNEVWVNGAASKGNVVLGSGTDKVWFGASDKTVNVNNYDGESDTIALIGNTMDFKAKKDSSGNVVITSATGSKLKLVAPSTDFVNVVDSTGAQYKVYAGDKTASATYSTNTDSKSLFVGFGSITADSTVEDATTLVANGANNRWGLNSAAMIDSSVKEINMSGSSADFTLVGSANVANTITGGTGTNYLNGGGASKDTLNGVAGAVDNFYFGKGDGEDTLVGVEADDFVQLYNVSAADIATIKADDPSNVVITMNDKSKLTINGLTDGATFVLTDGVYTYDSTAEGSKFTKL